MLGTQIDLIVLFGLPALAVTYAFSVAVICSAAAASAIQMTMHGVALIILNPLPCTVQQV